MMWGCVTTASASPGAMQIRRVDIPPSQPTPMPSAAEPADPALTEPQVAGALKLELPTIDEARAIDAENVADGTQRVDRPPELLAGAVALAVAAAERAKLRDANAEQLAAARLQLDRIAIGKQAERDRLARFREADAAHRAAMVEYRAKVEAARLARERWEADVVACRAGDRSRCGSPVAGN